MNINKKLNLHVPTWPEIKFWMEDGKVIRQRFLVGAYGLLMMILLIGAFVAARTAPVNIKPTKVGTTGSIGRNSASIKFDSARYNPKNNLIQINISGSDTSGVILSGKDISVSGESINGNEKVTMVPTTNNHWTLIVNNLDEHWGGFKLKIKSEIPQAPNTVNNSEQAQTFGININQSNIKNDSSLKKTSYKEVMLNALAKENDRYERLIKNDNSDINKLQDVIDFDNQKIDEFGNQQGVVTSSDKRKQADSIQKMRDEIATTQTQINEKNNKLKSHKKYLTQVKQKQTDETNNKDSDNQNIIRNIALKKMK